MKLHQFELPTKCMQIMIKSIGYVQQRNDEQNVIKIERQFRDGLKDIEKFSHLIILWWISENDNSQARSALVGKPPFEKAPETGVFASRSPFRPNPIGLTIVELLDVDNENSLLYVDHMDAFEGSPIIDIKPYIPNSEHIELENVRLPVWFAQLKVPRNV